MFPCWSMSRLQPLWLLAYCFECLLPFWLECCPDKNWNRAPETITQFEKSSGPCSQPGCRVIGRESTGHGRAGLLTVLVCTVYLAAPGKRESKDVADMTLVGSPSKRCRSHRCHASPHPLLCRAYACKRLNEAGMECLSSTHAGVSAETPNPEPYTRNCKPRTLGLRFEFSQGLNPKH